MPKEETEDLMKFLKPFPGNVKDILLWLRDFVWALYPGSNELIYDNYNAWVVGFAVSDKAGDAFCSLAMYSKYVNFGFNGGSEIRDQTGILKGNGSLYRHITVKDKKEFPKTAIKGLLKEAYANALVLRKDRQNRTKRQTIIKSTWPVQRLPPTR